MNRETKTRTNKKTLQFFSFFFRRALVPSSPLPLLTIPFFDVPPTPTPEPFSTTVLLIVGGECKGVGGGGQPVFDVADDASSY